MCGTKAARHSTGEHFTVWYSTRVYTHLSLTVFMTDRTFSHSHSQSPNSKTHAHLSTSWLTGSLNNMKTTFCTCFCKRCTYTPHKYLTHYRNKTDLPLITHFNPQASSSGMVCEKVSCQALYPGWARADRCRFLQKDEVNGSCDLSWDKPQADTRATKLIHLSSEIDYRLARESDSWGMNMVSN